MKLCRAGLKMMTAFGFFQILHLSIFGQEAIVRSADGYDLTVHIEEGDTFASVMGKIESSYKNYDGSGNAIDFFYEGNFYRLSVGNLNGIGRNYADTVIASEKEDIRYILKSLATKTYSDLLSSRGSLNRAGDRIDHIHPLRFLACIFLDEELKGCVHSVRDSKQVWKSFFTGLEDSLEEESQKNNMSLDFLQDFSNNLGINMSSVKDQVKNRKWSEFVDVLLKLLPRKGNPDRYDM